MRLEIVIVVAALGLAGCATLPEPTWVKPGATEADYRQDDSWCRREATETETRGVTGIGVGRLALNQELYLACMRGRGWTRRQ